MGEKINLNSISHCFQQHPQILEAAALIVEEKYVLVCARKSKTSPKKNNLIGEVKDKFSLRDAQIPNIVLFVNKIPKLKHNFKLNTIKLREIVKSHLNKCNN